MFRKLLDEAQAGDNIGALLRGVQRTEIERGQVLIKPGTVTCHKKFTCQVYVLTKDEGGRHTPFFNNYRPQFYFRTTDVTGGTSGDCIFRKNFSKILTFKITTAILQIEHKRYPGNFSGVVLYQRSNL